jgi:hypothetical protein
LFGTFGGFESTWIAPETVSSSRDCLGAKCHISLLYILGMQWNMTHDL